MINAKPTMSATASEVRSLRQRWATPEGKKHGRDVFELLKRGKMPSPVSIFGEVDGRADLRGIALEGGEIRKCVLKDVDFSYADFTGKWIEAVLFEDVIFEKSVLKEISERGNSFLNVDFRSTSFKGAGLGYQGTTFKTCNFSGCDFRGSVFIRAEFEDCTFEDNLLKGVDFNASSFTRCSFKGILDDVWFRGDYAFRDDLKEFGAFRRNKMEDVDLSKATLSWLSFSGGVPLGSVKLPNDPYVFRMDKLDQVLPVAARLAEQRFKGKDQEVAAHFFQVQSQLGIKEQPERIFTIADYVESEQGLSPNFLEALKSLLFDVRATLL